MNKEDYAAMARGMSDETIVEKLSVKRPSWNCGMHVWHQWRLALREEAEQRGLLKR